MKAMVVSDLITLRSSYLTILGITVFISIFIAIATDTLMTAVGCMAAMLPFMYIFSISSYDEQNGWERFRLTLPISRHQVAYGRYASTFIAAVCTLAIAVAIAAIIGLICDILPAGLVSDNLKLSSTDIISLIGTGLFAQLIIMTAVALTLPIIMRFGMTKGSRLVPVILVLALSAAAAFFGGAVDTADMTAFFGSIDAGIAWILAILTVLIAVLYIGSAFLSARLYDHREL